MTRRHLGRPFGEQGLHHLSGIYWVNRIYILSINKGCLAREIQNLNEDHISVSNVTLARSVS